ncbi:MAG: cardiolipin synthase [Alphaproteobacteria bacterium]|jgi:cardiolipin synthase
MITNLPNLLTQFRIAAIPGIIALFYLDSAMGQYLACGLFGVAAMTDFFDGYLARAYGQQSAFGRFLDPVADKLLVAAALLMMAGFGQVSGLLLLPTVVILCREILVSGLREFLAEINIGVPVSALAKWKTVIQMFAIGFLMVGDHGPEYIPAYLIGAIGLWIAAGFTLVTGYDYLKAAFRHIKRDDTRPKIPSAKEDSDGSGATADGSR